MLAERMLAAGNPVHWAVVARCETAVIVDEHLGFRAETTNAATARTVAAFGGTCFDGRYQPAFFFASLSQVSTTVSGFSETDSMPWSISHSARSGWSLGP